MLSISLFFLNFEELISGFYEKINKKYKIFLYNDIFISTLRGVTLHDTFTVAKQREVTLTLTDRNAELIRIIYGIKQ